jgi:hypothetical protein
MCFRMIILIWTREKQNCLCAYLYYYCCIMWYTVFLYNMNKLSFRWLLYFIQSCVQNYTYYMRFELVITLTLNALYTLLAWLFLWLQIIFILFLSTLFQAGTVCCLTWTVLSHVCHRQVWFLVAIIQSCKEKVKLSL